MKFQEYFKLSTLTKFYNPSPKNKYKDQSGKAALVKMALKKQEAAVVAKVYVGRSEPKHTETQTSQTGGMLRVTSSTIWNKKNFWRSLLQLKYQHAKTSLENMRK
jgi:hypothetical protein